LLPLNRARDMGCASVKPVPPPVPAPAVADVPAVATSDPPPSLEFARLMRDPRARATLLQHAQHEHSEENLLFFEDAQRFRGSFLRYGDEELSDQDRSRMRERASHIVNQFLTAEAEYALNLPSNQISTYQSGLKKDMEVKPNMFDPVCRTIYRAIEQDTFSRFKGTSAARELLKRFPGLGRRSTMPSTDGSGSSIPRRSSSKSEIYLGGASEPTGSTDSFQKKLAA